MQGRQCEETKQDQHTRPGAGGQSLSRGQSPEISGAGNCANGAHPSDNALGNCANGALPLNNALGNFLQWRGSAVLQHSPQGISPNLGKSGVADLQHGVRAHKTNFRQWRRCTAAPHTLREISPNLGRLIFKRHLSCPLDFLRFCEPMRLVHRVNQSCSVLGSAQPFGSSLASLRWRRLISFSRAVTTNCPVLSPSLFNNSTDSATWCGTRTSNLFDFALMDLVAITQVLVIRCPTIIYEKKAMAILDVSDTSKYYVSDTLILLKCKNSEARQCWSTNRASDHKPLSEVTIMAELQHTQDHPKFTWRFLALSSVGCNVVHIPANTEREAREQSPDGCVMVFAGRLPVREVRHEHA